MYVCLKNEFHHRKNLNRFDVAFHRNPEKNERKFFVEGVSSLENVIKNAAKQVLVFLINSFIHHNFSIMIIFFFHFHIFSSLKLLLKYFFRHLLLDLRNSLRSI